MENQKVSMDKLIDNLKINEKMKNEFKKLNFMYYNNYSEGSIPQPYNWKLSPEYSALDLESKKKIGIGGSIAGFLLGPFAYLLRGMFLKSFLLLLPAVIATFILPDSASDLVLRFLGFFYMYFCTTMLRKDYYFHKCLNNKMVKPYLLSRQVDFSNTETQESANNSQTPVSTMKVS